MVMLLLLLVILVRWDPRTLAPASHARQPGDACRDDGNPELLFRATIAKWHGSSLAQG